MNAETSRLRVIWYQLVDSSTGQPYKNTSADKVSVSQDADVTDFRDAVKGKWDEPGYLKGIPAGVLLVFKNKQTFDKRQSAVESRGEPLKSSAPLHVHGSTEEEAVIVVVPSFPAFHELDEPTAKRMRQENLITAWKNAFLTKETNAPSSLSLTERDDAICCTVPFYNNIFRAFERDEWIVFQEAIPSTKLNNLYIRESFQSIASSIMQDAASSIIDGDVIKVIITGTPGIGKSLFMIYLLHLLIKNSERVFFIYHPNNIYYDGEGGVFELKTIPATTQHNFWTKKLWCLFDAKSKSEVDLNTFPYEMCNFVLSASPRRNLVNDFRKPPVPKIFYMPPWSLKELEIVAPLFPYSTEWRHRFEILGGIARQVFEDLTRQPQAILSTACAQFSLDDCIRIIGFDSIITDHSNIIHSLVHVTSTAPFTESSVGYASQTAMVMIARKHEQEARRKLLELLSSYEGYPLISALCGYIFESYALRMLEKGGHFTCRLLWGNQEDVNATKSNDNELLLQIPPSTRHNVARVEEHQTSMELHVPLSKNYTAIDAWIPGLGAFQITVGKTHTLKESVARDLSLLGNGANKLYWLLHRHNFYEFTCKKSVEGIKQYAVLIPVDDKVIPY